jgi:hypothetical protein
MTEVFFVKNTLAYNRMLQITQKMLCSIVPEAEMAMDGLGMTFKR